MTALNDTFGVVFIGVIVAAVLYGFTCVQTWYFFTHYPSDPWHIKLLVACIFLSDTCHQVIITHVVYTYLVTYFGEVDMLEKIVWSMIAEVFFNGFTTFVVQCFLALRVYKLSNKNLLVTGSVMIFVIAEFLLIMVYGIKAMRFNTYIQLSSLKGLSMSVNALAAVGDLLISGFLCYMLWVLRTGFRKSDSLISKLVVFSINTGLLTSLCALASLISISAWPGTFIYIAFFFCIGRLYCNSLLATLNVRKGLGSDYDTDDVSHSFQGHGKHRKTNRTTLRTSSRRVPNNISIKVDTTQEYIQDEQYSSPSGDVKNLEVV